MGDLVYPGSAAWTSAMSDEIVEEKLKEDPYVENMDCTRCEGSGKMKIRMSTFGSSKPDEISEMYCMNCKGSGKMTEKQYIFQLTSDATWCKCEEDYDSTHASDGYDIFGNDTYICNSCGMVSQFG